jgi:hypothetical protein
MKKRTKIQEHFNPDEGFHGPAQSLMENTGTVLHRKLLFILPNALVHCIIQFDGA